ncbi:hypothetical protein HNY73_008131 [Argiope bruennichi]|uniref:Uncharacterized protein n=1 Tax=Argiope bruennichi TaxID=94029 RepID=A0A8T0F6C2_ARGBR|nr:hypothetical protein HNY73_008131 [Argiope bruennichi]
MSFGACVMKSERDIVPVAACRGWTDTCDFCDRRFGDWIDATEEHLAKIPTKQGILQIALKSKNVTETVNIILDCKDLQKRAYESVNDIKYIIADKKSKFSKSVIVYRWLTFNEGHEKILILCAHWYNNGVLPRFVKCWPGLGILQKTNCLTFSEQSQQWCYPKKDAFWKKPKPLPTKSVEVIKSCTLTRSCEICDAFFSEWQRLDEVIIEDKAPYAAGIYMLALSCEEHFEIVEIGHGPHVVINIKKSLDKYYYARSQILRRPEYIRRNDAFLLVRWMKLKNPESESCCYLYAHWLNTGIKELTCIGKKLPGKELLEKIKHFVIRTYDNKWCYETEVFKQHKITKSKQRRDILNEMKCEIRDFRSSD